MTVTNQLDPGPPYALTQNTIYALPASRVYLISSDLLQFSNTTVTTAFVNNSNSTTGMEAASQFVRCTAVTTCVVSIKKM